jgi:hypothetical protein
MERLVILGLLVELEAMLKGLRKALLGDYQDKCDLPELHAALIKTGTAFQDKEFFRG